ncbi:glucan phosphoethanolaminetransferase (alkaline phosphatase superfamily) [Acidovorax sp. 100]|uniref:phosphoethanolamine transferase n=1 Tax=Acidovorax sp. 100 TaxID=2135635 RepID=UPI000EFA084F|nr:phosphoethanolamine transferase [Acidovorax sp. 100]RMA59568.1 glucan phosphoethanolaminetransferase (alkaline phosphatase superfamily) [Acidovorax sp. 100]
MVLQIIKNFSKGREIPVPWWIFGAIIFVVNLPNFLWLESSGSLQVHSIEFLEKLLFCLLLTACFLTLFARPRQAWLVLYLLFLWWQPLALGVRFMSGLPINATMVGMAMATSPTELRNLSTIIPGQWFAFFIIWNMFCGGVLCALLKKPHWRWSWNFRSKVFIFNFALLALPYIVLSGVSKVPGEPVQPTTTSDQLDSIDFWNGFKQADQHADRAKNLSEAFPYELPFAILHYLEGRRAINAVRAHLSPPPPEYTLEGVQPRAEVVVLVIGESSTRNAWHWFNPQAPATTPMLEARAARGEYIFGYSQALAQTTSTRQAVPSMLSVQPLVWPDGSFNPKATYSIVSVAKQAGFATAWLSNQAAIGTHDGIIAAYAQEAEAQAFLNPSGFADQGNFDNVLLPALQRYLAENSRAFVVLHTMGSHFNYKYRYPNGFGPYPNSRDAREAYFNSVAYTDTILDQIVEMLARDGRKAVLLYASDHGEAVPGGACNVGSANRNTIDAYEVPVLVWLSRSYGDANRALAERLAQHQTQSYTVAAIPQTLIDLMRGDIREPTPGLQSLAWSSRRHNSTWPESLSVWVEKYKKAAEKNPCFVLIR